MADRINISVFCSVVIRNNFVKDLISLNKSSYTFLCCVNTKNFTTC